MARPLVHDSRILADMHPEVRRLFAWHPLEEMEHQSVAGDVYRHLFGKSVPWNERARAFHAATRLLLQTSREIYSALLLCVQLPIHRRTNAKKSPVESPHMRMPVNASTGARFRQFMGNMTSP